MRLSGPEHFAWLVMRRVRRGGMTCFEGSYYEDGQPIFGCLVPDVLAVLFERGLVVVDEPDPMDGGARVRLTEAGQARYTELIRKQRGILPVPPPEHAHPDSSISSNAESDAGGLAGHRSSAAPLNAPPGNQSGPSTEYTSGPPGWWAHGTERRQ